MFERYIENKNRIFYALILITLGSIIRISLHNNLPRFPSIYITINGITQPMFMFDLFFIIAVISIISGFLLGGYYTIIIPISIMIITDLFLGNNWILLFTWSGFAFLGLIGFLLKKKKQNNFRYLPRIFGFGIVGILLYDIWTNFGTWLGGWYSHSFEGFFMCYLNALPFMFWHLLSTTITLTIVIVPIIYLKKHNFKNLDFKIKPLEDRITFYLVFIMMVVALFSIII